MDENKEREHAEEQQVIQEQIVPKKNKNWKRFGKGLVRAVIYGVVFGAVGGVTLVLTGNLLIEKLGLDNSLRQMVGIGTATQAPAPTGVPGHTTQPMPTGGAHTSDTPTPPGLTVTPSKTTPGVTVTIDGNDSESGKDTPVRDETVQGFLNMYSGIAQLSEELEKSLVRITAITEGVDWFEEAYETVGNATGLYVGDNGRDMLFLVNLDSIEGATKFNVTFANGETLPCSIFSYDTNYRLAVVSVRLSAVAHIDKEWRSVLR